jgi:hypothetical protein
MSSTKTTKVESYPLYSVEAKESIKCVLNYVNSTTSDLNDDNKDKGCASIDMAIGINGQFYYNSSSSSSSSSEGDDASTSDDSDSCSTPKKDGDMRTTKRNATMIANKKISQMTNGMETSAQQVKDLQTISTASMVPSVMIPFPPFGQKEENSNSKTQSEPKEGQQHTTKKQRVLIISTALLKPRRTDWNAKSVCLEYWNLVHQLQYEDTTTNTTTSTIQSSNSNSLGGYGRRHLISVILLRSGRFAAGVFSHDRCLVHRTSTRYTVRRGQGGAQSAHDTSRGKAKSIGSQLRREGEKALYEDVTKTMTDWATTHDSVLLFFISCPKVMRKPFFDACGNLLTRDDTRIRYVPMSIGRPTYEEVLRVYNTLMELSIGEIVIQQQGEETLLKNNSKHEEEIKTTTPSAIPHPLEKIADQDKSFSYHPYTPLHEAAERADVSLLRQLLLLQTGSDKEGEEDNDETLTQMNTKSTDTTSPFHHQDIDARAGPKEMTPLHLVSSYKGDNMSDAATCILLLLEYGHANPCIVDLHGRPPYFLATHDKLRDAFRLARGTLGEEYCAWDRDAKVDPPLTKDLLQQKKDKAADKKRRQRARQKEQKAKEKKQAEEKARLERQKEEEEQQKLDAKRGLKPKASSNSNESNICDFCQKRTMKRTQMFFRIGYAYCSTDCVRAHQRELMATAAMARLST